MPYKIRRALACRGHYDIMVAGQSIYRGTRNECTTESQRLIVKGLLVNSKDTGAVL